MKCKVAENENVQVKLSTVVITDTTSKCHFNFVAGHSEARHHYFIYYIVLSTTSFKSGQVSKVECDENVAVDGKQHTPSDMHKNVFWASHFIHNLNWQVLSYLMHLTTYCWHC